MVHALLTFLALILALSGGLRAETASLDPALDYRAERINPVTYEVDLSAVVTAPYKTKLLRVWMPVPQSDYGQQLTSSRLSTFPAEVEPKLGTEPIFGNKFAYFEFKNPEGAQVVRHRFNIKVWELRWNLDPDKVQTVQDWPEPFEPYLRGEQQSVVIDERFRTLIEQIVPAPNNAMTDMRAVIDWVNDNVQYTHDNASLKASSAHALEERAGHCSDYHGFCAALGRTLGYPTRVTYGINPFPKASPSHCKLEAYLPPYGWVSFDVSETQKLMHAIRAADQLDGSAKQAVAAAARQRLMQGFRDNTWFLQTKGTDYQLAPPAAKAVPVVRTIYAEADGQALEDPDPSNTEQTRFAWMTVHKYVADREVPYPFKDLSTLEWDLTHADIGQ